MGDRGIAVQCVAGQEILLFPLVSRLALGPTSLLLLTWGKVAEVWSWLSLYNADRMDGAVPPLEFAYMVTCLIKHRANLLVLGLYYLLRYCLLGYDIVWFGRYVSWFQRNCCFILYPEDGESRSLWNNATYLLKYTASHPRRPQSDTVYCINLTYLRNCLYFSCRRTLCSICFPWSPNCNFCIRSRNKWKVPCSSWYW